MKVDPANKFSLQLQPLPDIHFNGDYDHDNIRKAHLPTLYSLIVVALFILIIAMINFINLSTAQSIQRAKEVGVRKVLGGGRTTLILQFLTETFILVCFASCIAVFTVRYVLVAFGDFIPPGVEFHLFHPSTLSFLLVVAMATTLFAGYYPASILSSYVPALSLKGGTKQQRPGAWNLRKGLIIFQFTLSLIFIISTIVITSQIGFMRNSDFGMRTDAIMNINNWDDGKGKMKIFAESIRRLPGIENVVLQGKAPVFIISEEPIRYKDKVETEMMVSIQAGNEHFIPFYQMKLLAGRNLEQSDSLKECLINETYCKALGFETPDKAIGKFLYRNGKAVPVAGVVADFHEGPFHEPIGPVFIAHIPELEKSVGIKLTSDSKRSINAKYIISRLELQWKKIFPDIPFNYHFLDDSINSFYKQEEKTALLARTSMLITIFISCMGLFGLVMFSTEKRKKEIGIRKILGASVARIVTMLSKDIVILLLIAALIASPIAWYFMNNWLQNFAYRIQISGWIFIGAGFGTSLIALFTISIHTIKAGTANPVRNLKTE